MLRHLMGIQGGRRGDMRHSPVSVSRPGKIGWAHPGRGRYGLRMTTTPGSECHFPGLLARLSRRSGPPNRSDIGGMAVDFGPAVARPPEHRATMSPPNPE